ncbi:MAG: hypothetical protein ABI273_22465 [Lacunisphaera sp.]
MHIGGIEVKRRVWISLGFAVVVIASWWLWTSSVVVVTPVQPSANHPSVVLAAALKGPGDSALREQAEYMDPTPLFFPTKWNFVPENIIRQPGQIFGWIEPKLVFLEPNIKSNSAESPTSAANLAEIVKSGNEAPFAGIGERNIVPVVLDERGGFLEISRLRDGKTIIAQKLENIPGLDANFSPFEFLISVCPSGLNADPIVMNGSGREEMEVFLRTFLAKSFRVGERLAPGTYRILIGP